MELKEIFELVKKAAQTSKVPCRIKLSEGWNAGVVIEYGYDFPEKVMDKMMKAMHDLGLKYDAAEHCADQHGPNLVDYAIMNGGPKRY